MSRIFVHVHVYYPQMWAELKACIENITLPYDLHVTTVEEYPELTADVLSLCPHARVECVINRGYDVGPFIHAIGQINLDDYDYVIKLHTKRDMPAGALLNGYPVDGPKWRQYMLGFLSSSDAFNKTLNTFEQRKKVGMCAHHILIASKTEGDADAGKYCRNRMLEMGMPVSTFKFVAGTMFMARADLLKPLMSLNIKIEDFPVPVRGEPTTLAHIMERMFGALIYAQGFTIQDGHNSYIHILKDKLIHILCKIGFFIYRKKITKSGNLTIKVLKIPVYRKKVVSHGL